MKLKVGLFTVLVFCCLLVFAEPAISLHKFQVEPDVETTMVDSMGDAADDIAVWVHPTQPEKSLIIGTDKKYGVITYNLEGQVVQKLSIGKPNNLDIRQNVLINNKRMDIIAASERTSNEIVFLTIDPKSLMLSRIDNLNPIKLQFDIYGVCLGIEKDFIAVYATSKTGQMEALKIEGLNGGLTLVKTSEYRFSSQIEGCVHDDYWQKIYVGEEDVGVWSLNTKQGHFGDPKLIDVVNGENQLTADVEGVSLYIQNQTGEGHLLVSSQGSNSFLIYDRATGDYEGQFKVVASSDIDEVSQTDGIDVASGYIGDKFPMGIFIAQDNENDKGMNQNFKILDWRKIANQLKNLSK